MRAHRLGTRWEAEKHHEWPCLKHGDRDAPAPGPGSLQAVRDELLAHVRWCEEWDRRLEAWRYSR